MAINSSGLTGNGIGSGCPTSGGNMLCTAKNSVIAMPAEMPMSTSRPTCASRHWPPISLVQPIRLSGEERRTYGSSPR